jgi:hypothetical protein
MSKLILAAAAALLLTAGAAGAQSPTPAPMAMAPGATMAPAAGGLSLDTPIEQIVANPAGKAVLDKDIPGLTTHPAYDQFKSMSLKEVQPMSQGALTDPMLAKAGTDLAALPK